MLWRYSYVLDYTYSVLCYGNAVRHYIFDKKKEESDEWILIEPKEPSVIIEEIEIPPVDPESEKDELP
jgi:hypothetical protein